MFLLSSEFIYKYNLNDYKFYVSFFLLIANQTYFQTGFHFILYPLYKILVKISEWKFIRGIKKLFKKIVKWIYEMLGLEKCL